MARWIPRQFSSSVFVGRTFSTFGIMIWRVQNLFKVLWLTGRTKNKRQWRRRKKISFSSVPLLAGACCLFKKAAALVRTPLLGGEATTVNLAVFPPDSLRLACASRVRKLPCSAEDFIWRGRIPFLVSFQKNVCRMRDDCLWSPRPPVLRPRARRPGGRGARSRLLLVASVLEKYII